MPLSEHASTLSDLAIPRVVVGEIQAPWKRLQEAAAVDQQEGQAAICKGKLGVVLLAGGHGSRLGSSEPKGCFPISPVRGASLFQLFAEQLRAAEEFYQTQIPVIVWVSRDNVDATRAFWNEHANWGLDPEFIVQPDLPLLDDRHQPLLDAQGHPISAPNGNGSLWRTLATEGVLQRWVESGVEVVSVVPIDNPLAPLADAGHVSALITDQCKVLLLTTHRRSPTEAVGVVLHDKGRIAEYSELPPTACGEEGWQRYPEGFLGITYWSMEQAHAASNLELPIHMARKTVTVEGQRKQAWKQEYFIFDALAGQTQCGTRCLDRRLVFAPLKSAEGEYGVEATQAALVQAAQLRAQGCGCSQSLNVRELSAELLFMESADWTVRTDGWAEARSCPIRNSR